MKDIIRAAAAVVPVRPGNVDYNLSGIVRYIREAKEKQVRILAFPELCVTGYTCGDLFFNETLLEAAKNAVLSLGHEADGIAFAVGAPLSVGGQLYNCAFFFADGKLLGVVPKMYLPNYSEFNEKRWFRSGFEATADSVRLGERDIPFGGGLIFAGEDGVNVGIELCEDFWTPIPPSSLLAMGGANIILNLSASPAAAAKREYRRSLVVGQSARLSALYIYASAGCDESTADFICSGHSMIASCGICLAENRDYVASDYMITVDSDLGCGKSDRMRLNRFSDSVHYCDVSDKLRTLTPSGLRFTAECPPADQLKLNKYPFIPDDPAACTERVNQLFEMQAAALAKRLELTGCRPVVGVSGGLDSTLALLVSIRAAERLGKPASYVLGITMPCFGTSGSTFNNSLGMMNGLGIETKTVKIGDSVKQHFIDIGHSPDKFDAAFENAQARERTQVLMDVANMVGGLVVGTGDLSELALGWCTYNGDHMSMYAVNCSLPKTLIRRMVAELSQTERFSAVADALMKVVNQPISPELLPPDAQSGKIAQITEDIVGPYELHDFFLFYLVRFGYGPAKIYELAKLAFAGDYSDETIKKWLSAFCRRFFTQQFKRSCSPDGVKLGSVFLSPRGGWNVPTDADGSLWRREIERL